MRVTADSPPVDEDLVSTASEREVLERFLDHHRAVLSGKLRGLSTMDVRRRLVPSQTTLAGLVKHATVVERNWFQHCLAQRPLEEIAGQVPRDASSWDVHPDESIDDILASFVDACAESRRIAARFALDDTVAHRRLGRVSLRWIYVHMIREHARHAGHADILREQIDGATGD